ncbi:MAG: 4-hydroxy-tetrahydrodipicolinate synthase [Gammaproteobacteria bacterium]|nr:4-hydroxy-tetrahydrodipicolinate synthase [Gammaproteobacteria bacterium]MDE2345787.1 4-hydroxy-tetrahydrodipicolinate synthase [Gammaproteobacteria bacterium]
MFQGSIVALVTPMAEDGRVDYAALEELVQWHVAEGTDGIVAVGTTGESATLESHEHMRVLDSCLRASAGRIPVIAGSGSNSTSHAIALTRLAQSRGAAAALVVTPYYNKPTQEGLYQHFRAIAEAVSLPLILYNVPSRCAVDMLPGTIARLAEIKNIIGIKEATGKLDRVKEIRDDCGGNFLLLSGDDATAKEFMLAGGQGVISVTANVAPKLMHAMSVAACAGNRSQADILNQRLAELHKNLFLESNPIPVKWALTEMGRIPPGIRLPLTRLAPSHHDLLRNTLRSMAIL